MPWMITTGFFMYLMVYAAIIILVNDGEWVLIPVMILPITGSGLTNPIKNLSRNFIIFLIIQAFLGYALYSVQLAFDRIRKEELPAYSNLMSKKDFVNYI